MAEAKLDPHIALEMYNQLLRVRPTAWDTKYPYNEWTPQRVIFTQKEIKLRAQSIKGGRSTSEDDSPAVLVFSIDFGEGFPEDI